MTTLGEVLTRLHDRTEIYQLRAESGNVLLIAKLDQMVNDTGTDPCEAALRAVQAFAAQADAEAWVKLVGCVQDSHSPAGACLSEMIAWSMAH